MERQDNETPVQRIGSRIDLKTAIKWTKYSRQRQPDEVISHLFGRNIIDKILSQDDCMGIRIYYANSKPITPLQKLVLILINFLKNAAGTTGEKHLILVGTNSANKDQIPKKFDQAKKPVTEPEPQLRNLNASADEDYIMGEQAVPCPASGCPSNELTGMRN